MGQKKRLIIYFNIILTLSATERLYDFTVNKKRALRGFNLLCLDFRIEREFVMTPSERVMTVLSGNKPDIIPCTIYSNKIFGKSYENIVRSRGMCVIHMVYSFSVGYSNVIHKVAEEVVNGKKYVHTVIETPYGQLTSLVEQAGFTNWTHEYLFKTKEDYKKIAFLLKNETVVENYGRVFDEINKMSIYDDVVIRDNLLLEPIQRLISEMMGTETFCIEWMDNRDEILKLYDIMTETARKIYPIVADGPIGFANYGGNVTPEVIGREVFSKYYIPNYEEAAEVLHKKNKKIGTHLDANNSLIMDLVAKTSLDYIEAFDPSMGPSIATAKEAWPNKLLWINWPSAFHLEPRDKIYEITKELIKESGDKENFIIGITEDIPEYKAEENYLAILEAINDYGRFEITKV